MVNRTELGRRARATHGGAQVRVALSTSLAYFCPDPNWVAFSSMMTFVNSS